MSRANRLWGAPHIHGELLKLGFTIAQSTVLGHPGSVRIKLSRWAILLFPTDVASFLDLIRQHGDAAYSLMFAYAASHSLLLALFPGYAAHSGALGFGTLIMVCWFGSFAGDVIRFCIGRRFGTQVAAHRNSGHHRTTTTGRRDGRRMDPYGREGTTPRLFYSFNFLTYAFKHHRWILRSTPNTPTR
jgi:hypothetical protein